MCSWHAQLKILATVRSFLLPPPEISILSSLRYDSLLSSVSVLKYADNIDTWFLKDVPNSAEASEDWGSVEKCEGYNSEEMRFNMMCTT